MARSIQARIETRAELNRDIGDAIVLLSLLLAALPAMPPRSKQTPGMGRAEFELREALRLEEVECRRASSVSRRAVASGSGRIPEMLQPASPLAPGSSDAALDGALASLGQSLAALETEMAAGLAAGEVRARPFGPAT